MSGRERRLTTLAPSLVSPDHFYCKQSAEIVAVFSEPLGEENDRLTLLFPSNIHGKTSTVTVIPQKIGLHTIIFNTPEYDSSRGVVVVTPVLHLVSGDVKLPCFSLTIKHPIRSVMELCLGLSTSEAVLPVLISLMINCGEDIDQFKMDPHVDIIMSTLVGSLGSSSSPDIKDILIPNKKWKNASLIDFAKHFGLIEMEKQANHLKPKQRTIGVNKLKSRLRIQTSRIGRHEGDSQPKRPSSAPLVHSSPKENTVSGHDYANYPLTDMSVDDEVVSQVCSESPTRLICEVVEDYHPTSSDRIPLRVGEEVLVVKKLLSGVWFGKCGNKTGCFPSKCVRLLRRVEMPLAGTYSSPQGLDSSMEGLSLSGPSKSETTVHRTCSPSESKNPPSPRKSPRITSPPKWTSPLAYSLSSSGDHDSGNGSYSSIADSKEQVQSSSKPKRKDEYVEMMITSPEYENIPTHPFSSDDEPDNSDYVHMNPAGSPDYVQIDEFETTTTVKTTQQHPPTEIGPDPPTETEPDPPTEMGPDPPTEIGPDPFTQQ